MTYVPRTIEDWLFTLKHRESYHDNVADPSDPYNKAVSSYQAFNRSIIDGLERKDPDVVSLVHEHSLDLFFQDIFTKRNAKALQLWLKDAMLKHPLRRTPRQYVTLALIRAQDCADYRSVKSKVFAATMDYIEWMELVYNPESLVKDPSSTYFLRNKNGNKEVGRSDSSDTQTSDACLICTDDFDDMLHLAQRAPCGHIICRVCFDNWLLECRGKFTCPLCRACVVCGTNDCEHHNVRQDIVPPLPLPDVLDELMPSARGQVLHGIEPEHYFFLRERTRKDRALLSWIEGTMKTQSGSVLEQLQRDYAEVWARLKAAILDIRV